MICLKLRNIFEGKSDESLWFSGFKRLFKKKEKWFFGKNRLETTNLAGFRSIKN